MGTMTIDGRKVEFTDEKNVLTVIRNADQHSDTVLSFGTLYIWCLSFMYGRR